MSTVLAATNAAEGCEGRRRKGVGGGVIRGKATCKEGRETQTGRRGEEGKGQRKDIYAEWGD